MNSEGDALPVEIDVNVMRHAQIALNRLVRVDDSYTFYYDETNNIRRLHVTADGLNVPDPQVFVLGGIGHRGPPRSLDIAGLKHAVRLQSNAPELKLTHLGKGDILGLLKSWRVEAFLDWLVSEDLLAHYSAVDPLYWSTVDIIDSIISHDELAHMQAYAGSLKTDLFTVLSADFDDLADLFHRYSYPNVGEDNRLAFLGEVIDRVEARTGLLPGFNAQVLLGVLQGGTRGDRLIYLEDEAPNTLLDSFVSFFINRICLFKNAWHRLDVEPTIQERLQDFVFKDGNRVLDNFTFVDSRTDPAIQAADALAGLIGKLFSYVARSGPRQIVADRQALTPGQLRTLGKLNAVLDRSDAETTALLHQVAAGRAMRAGQYFLTGG